MYFASDTAGSMFSRDIPIIRNLVQNMKRNNVLKLNLIGRTPIGRVCHRFVLFRTKLQAKASTHIFNPQYVCLMLRKPWAMQALLFLQVSI